MLLNDYYFEIPLYIYIYIYIFFFYFTIFKPKGKLLYYYMNNEKFYNS